MSNGYLQQRQVLLVSNNFDTELSLSNSMAIEDVRASCFRSVNLHSLRSLVITRTTLPLSRGVDVTGRLSSHLKMLTLILASYSDVQLASTDNGSPLWQCNNSDYCSSVHTP